MSLLHCLISPVSLVWWTQRRCLAHRRRRRRRRALVCDWPIAEPWQPLVVVAAVVRTNNYDRESNADVDEHRDDAEEDDGDGVELELERLQSTGDCAKESRLVSTWRSDWSCCSFHRRKYHYRRNPHGENGADESDDGDDDDR